MSTGIYNLTFFSSNVFPTLDGDILANEADLTTPYSYPVDAYFVNDEIDMESEMTVGPGGFLHNTGTVRQTFDIETVKFKVSDFKAEINKIKLLFAKRYLFLKIENYEFESHPVDKVIPIACYELNPQKNSNGYKWFQIACKKVYNG